MLGSLGRVGGRGGSGSGPVFGARLVQPGAIAGGGIVSFSRSQVSSFSSALNASSNYVEYAADVPRFNGASQRLLLEGQRTNGVPNPRSEGAGFPTGWFGPTGLAAGITLAVSAPTIENGYNFVTITLSGTATSTSTGRLALMPRNSFACTTAQTAAAGVFVGLGPSGVISGLNGLQLAMRGYSAVPNDTETVGAQISLAGVGVNFQRFTTFGTPVNALTAFVAPTITFAIVNGATVNVSFRVAFPSIETATFASTVVLPPVNSPAASTRGQDNFTSAFSSLFPTGVGTVLMSCMIPQSAPTGIDQVLLDINDGSADNRIRLRNVAAGNTIVAGRTIATVNTDATTLGSMTPGTLFRVGLTFDGTEIVANFNGGTNQTVAGVPTGLTTLRIGNNSAGTGGLFGEVGYVDVLPYVIPAANLPAAVTAIP